jgi:hypothetical protein
MPIGGLLKSLYEAKSSPLSLGAMPSSCGFSDPLIDAFARTAILKNLLTKIYYSLFIL